ncbi:iqgap- protein [Ciborinia camelliae]|nr:iqgap- protein [Ciborinia camelliae]
MDDPEADVKALFMETKRCILYIIRVQSGPNLMEILRKQADKYIKDLELFLIKEQQTQPTLASVSLPILPKPTWPTTHTGATPHEFPAGPSPTAAQKYTPFVGATLYMSTPALEGGPENPAVVGVPDAILIMLSA